MCTHNCLYFWFLENSPLAIEVCNIEHINCTYIGEWVSELYTCLLSVMLFPERQAK